MVVSLPAFFAVFAGSYLVYEIAVVSGYSGSALQAVIKLLSSWKGSAALIPLFLLLIHIGLFTQLLIRFARGAALPVFAQIYCVTIVLLAIGERIRLLFTDGGASFWFGLFSLPHACCLLAILWVNQSESQRINKKFPDSCNA
jgi:hypothetical protein